MVRLVTVAVVALGFVASPGGAFAGPEDLHEEASYAVSDADADEDDPGVVRRLRSLAAHHPTGASASDDGGTYGASAQVVVTPPRRNKVRHFGALVDFGAPDLLGVALVGRPLRWMRLHLGAVTNFAAPGIRGGVTFVPINYYISPSITIEGGKIWEGDATAVAAAFGFQSRSLTRFGYDFMNAHLGIELGAPNRFLFFIHAGISYVATELRGIEDMVRQDTGDPTITVSDPSLRYWGPSGKIGFALYL